MKVLRITAIVATLFTGITVLTAAQAFTLESLPNLSGSTLNYEVRNGAATLYNHVDASAGQPQPGYWFEYEQPADEVIKHTLK